MPSRPARTARSSSRSSKTSEAAAARPALDVTTPDPSAVAVGQLGAPHGLRGALRLRPYQAGVPSLAPGRAAFLEREGTWHAATVEHTTQQGRGMLITFSGIADRDAAAALTGMRVLVRKRDLPALAEGEFYHYELHGCAVVTTDGRALGTIEATLSTGLNDVWVVRDRSREHLIPIIADVVREIDATGRRVVIHVMPGLLE